MSNLITTGRPARHTPPGTSADKAHWQRVYRASRAELTRRQNLSNQARRAAERAMAKAHPAEFAHALEVERAKRGLLS